MFKKIKSLVRLSRVTSRLIAKVKILTCHKKLLLEYIMLLSATIIVLHFGLSYSNFSFISPLEALGSTLCTLFIPAVAIWMFDSDKVIHFRNAIKNGDIKKISLFIESGLEMEKVKNHIWAEMVIFAEENISRPKNLDYEVTRFVDRVSENSPLMDKIIKISEEMKKVLEFANQKPKREATDRALVYSTNLHSTKLQSNRTMSRVGLPNDMQHQILTFSEYPKTQDTERLRRYEIEDALHNPRPRVSFCNRVMSWFSWK